MEATPASPFVCLGMNYRSSMETCWNSQPSVSNLKTVCTHIRISVTRRSSHIFFVSLWICSCSTKWLNSYSGQLLRCD
ncbi:hypothetical protein T09_13077 [Trichinella sp. T9]|nr:hypothetical protein T09_13077 [Trichinella sp. T9]